MTATDHDDLMHADVATGHAVRCYGPMLAALEAVLPWLERMDVLRLISGRDDFPLLEQVRDTLALARGE